MHEPSPRRRHSGRHLPSLDGLRAISIGLVLVYHVMVSQTVSWGRYFVLFNGALGVRIFFCISGFIITYLLLMEAETAGISLKSFHLRRALRILPANYAYLAMLFVLTLTSALQVRMPRVS
jgi:peptidoglycan/LPS O-acetylase OafA/YrhL